MYRKTYRDELDEYWKGTIWQRRVHEDREEWKRDAEAVAKPRDTDNTVVIRLMMCT